MSATSDKRRIVITDKVRLDELNEYTYLVSDDNDNEYVTIEGPVEMSSSMPGLYMVETSIGMVYLDPEFTVRAGNPASDYSSVVDTDDPDNSENK